MKIDWKIIRNWALGEASEKEKQEVERWGEMGEENRNFLEDTYNYYCEESMVENPSPQNIPIPRITLAATKLICLIRRLLICL